MFEIQKQKNPDLIFLYEEAEKCLTRYPFLRDFCTYLNKRRQLDFLEGYFLHAEIHWMQDLCEYGLEHNPFEYEERITHFLEPDDDVPALLKLKLFSVYDHLSGVVGQLQPNQSDEEDFARFYKAKYHPSMPYSRLRRGKQILRQYELELLKYNVINKFWEPTKEEWNRIELANAIIDDHGFDTPIPENFMVKALEYADKHGLTVVTHFDEKDCYHPNFGASIHPEYAEIRSLALSLLDGDSFFDNVVMTYHRGSYFKFIAYKQDEVCPPGMNNVIIVKDGVASWQ